MIKSGDPEWNEKFRFYPTSKHDTLFFTVLDYDGPAGSETIGTCKLALEDLPEIGISSADRWMETEEQTGKIQVGVRWIDRSAVDHSNLEIVRDPNVLKIDVIEAKGLKAMDSSTGSSDPYVIVHMGDPEEEHHRTRTIEQDLNPAWNENFTLWAPVGGEDGKVHLSLYDQDPFDSDPLGDVVVPLEQLRDKGPVNGWYRVENGTGKIRLILEWTFDPEAGKTVSAKQGFLYTT